MKHVSTVEKTWPFNISSSSIVFPHRPTWNQQKTPAIVGAAGVPFFFASSSQFDEVEVELGAKRSASSLGDQDKVASHYVYH